MKANVGSIDKFLRLVLGAVLVSLVFIGPQTPWGWLGLIPIATGLVGWCPAYRLFGINTCGTAGEQGPTSQG